MRNGEKDHKNQRGNPMILPFPTSHFKISTEVRFLLLFKAEAPKPIIHGIWLLAQC